MAGGLEQILQDDFAAGMFRGTARHLISSRGVYDVENGLLDEDGSIYRRGGTELRSTDPFNGGLPINWIWKGVLGVGERTIFANVNKFAALDDTLAPVDLEGGGLARPVGHAVVDGMLFIGGGVVYGGSRKAAPYSTGTVTVTQGSRTVTGAGTAWLANVDAGMLLRLAGRYYVVASVESNTSLTLLQVYEGANAAGQAYTLTRLGSAAAHGAKTASHYATVAGRLVCLEGRRIDFSEGVNTGESVAALVGQSRAHSFLAENWHELPAGASGLGLAVARDRLLIFTTAGLFALSGLAYDIRDDAGNPQHRMDLVSGDLVLAHASGLVPYDNAVIAPCRSGVYMVDGISSPLRLDRSISALWEDYMRLGRAPGGAAVHRGHLLLPVVDGPSSATMVDFLVCRLNRPVQTRAGDVFPWTRFSGHAAPRALTIDAIAGAEDGHVITLEYAFAPSNDHPVDADADATEFALAIETRDFTMGDRNESLWRRMRLRYYMQGGQVRAYASAGRDAAVQAEWDSVNWDEFVWGDSSLDEFMQLAGAAPDTDRLPYAWEVVLRGEFIRYRLVSSGPIETLTIRALESSARRTGKVFA